jgi:hypothetical protein
LAVKRGYVQNSSPEKVFFAEKGNRHAGAGLKIGLLYPGPVVMMRQAVAPISVGSFRRRNGRRNGSGR